MTSGGGGGGVPMQGDGEGLRAVLPSLPERTADSAGESPVGGLTMESMMLDDFANAARGPGLTLPAQARRFFPARGVR